MRRSLFSAALLSAAALVSADCPVNGNNCARAVTGTAQGQSLSRRADCVAFLRCTVTPATSTFLTTLTITPSATATVITVPTSTVTSTSSPGAAAAAGKRRRVAANDAHFQDELERRQAGTAAAITNCPTAVPVYASACTAGGSSIAYASACSCAGVSRVYTVLTSPVTTVIVTQSAPTPTSTSRVVPVATVTASPPFVIRVGTAVGASGPYYVNTVQANYPILNYDSMALATGTVLQIVNGILRDVSSGAPITVRSGTNLASYIYVGDFSSGLGSVDTVPAGFGAFSGDAGGYALVLQLGARYPRQEHSDPPSRLVVSTGSYYDIPQLYAVLV